ncbi:kinase-like domain-containing protein [Syncephalis fuscata]|nr:kinase-like domain-containing protein [Syncephalis fuscata]
MQAYKSLKDLQGTVENADGAEFVKQVVHDFEWNGMQCFVTPSRCDKTLEYYTAHIPNQQKHDLLLKLMIQVLHGTAYLHRHNTTYNDFTPTTICVNSDKRSEPKALLFNFKKSSFLKFVTEKKVFLNFPHRPYVLDSQEWKMEQYVDMRKQDLWNIAALFYALLFNISPYKDSQKLYEHREDMTSFNLRRFTSIQYRSRLLTKMIKDMLVWNSKERPTPEEYLESAKFISESK